MEKERGGNESLMKTVEQHTKSLNEMKLKIKQSYHNNHF